MTYPHPIVRVRFTALILVVLLASACRGMKAGVNETWTLVELVTEEERTDTVTDVIEVRNCGTVERKTVQCSTGTLNELTVSLGVSFGGSAGFEGSIDPGVSSSLGIGRDSGESLDLNSPPEGFVYRYPINKKYRVLAGEVLARSSTGDEQTTDYAFYANCSLRIETPETLTCEESDQAVPAGVEKAPSAPQSRDYRMISLRRLGSTEESNLGLDAGINTLLGTPFETGWIVTTQCEDRPSLPTTIQLDASIPQPVNVYLLLQAGWAMQQFSGKQLGEVTLSFSDGGYVDTPLAVGFNIRDWARESSQAVTTATSPMLREGWQGTAPDGTAGRMDILSIEIPNEYRHSTLTNIQVADTSSTTADSQNPCIHLLAITVEHLR
jgi:hypothetical protein